MSNYIPLYIFFFSYFINIKNIINMEHLIEEETALTLCDSDASEATIENEETNNQLSDIDHFDYIDDVNDIIDLEIDNNVTIFNI